MQPRHNSKQFHLVSFFQKQIEFFPSLNEEEQWNLATLQALQPRIMAQSPWNPSIFQSHEELEIFSDYKKYLAKNYTLRVKLYPKVYLKGRNFCDHKLLWNLFLQFWP